MQTMDDGGYSNQINNEINNNNNAHKLQFEHADHDTTIVLLI